MALQPTTDTADPAGNSPISSNTFEKARNLDRPNIGHPKDVGRSPEWHADSEEGLKKWEAFRNSYRKNAKKKSKDIVPSKEVWRWDLNDAYLVQPPESVKSMLKSKGMNPGEYWCHRLIVYYHGKVGDPEAHFGNLYCPRYGLIVAMSNYKPQEPGVERWSDIVWYFWVIFCKAQNVHPSALRWVYRHEIENVDTKRIFFEVMSANYGTEADFESIVLPLTPQDPDFYPVLRSPNVIGTLYLLSDHLQIIGRKSISRFELSQNSDILVEYEDLKHARTNYWRNKITKTKQFLKCLGTCK